MILNNLYDMLLSDRPFSQYIVFIMHTSEISTVNFFY